MYLSHIKVFSDVIKKKAIEREEQGRKDTQRDKRKRQHAIKGVLDKQKRLKAGME